MKKILYGLTATSYMHETEAEIRNNSDDSSSAVNKFNDISVAIVRKITLGKYIEIKKDIMPNLITLVEEVCRILDFNKTPKVYVCKDDDIYVLAAGTDDLQITMSDYVVENFDDDMLRFVIGNAIGMFKGGHTALNTVCSVMSCNIMLRPFKMALQQKLRAADLSSDRAGLLACQNIKAALMCLLAEAGLPISYTCRMNESEILKIADRFVKGAENYSKNKATMVSTMWGEINSSVSTAYKRTKELYLWYMNGYEQVLARYGR